MPPHLFVLAVIPASSVTRIESYPLNTPHLMEFCCLARFLANCPLSFEVCCDWFTGLRLLCRLIPYGDSDTCLGWSSSRGRGAAQGLLLLMLFFSSGDWLSNVATQSVPEEMEQHPRKRGRPRIVVTDVVLQQRRLAKQCSKAKRVRPKSNSCIFFPDYTGLYFVISGWLRKIKIQIVVAIRLVCEVEIQV